MKETSKEVDYILFFTLLYFSLLSVKKSYSLLSLLVLEIIPPKGGKRVFVKATQRLA